jgi:hypothetical protein
LCFNVIYPTVSGMILLSLLLAFAVVPAFAAVLVGQGFRHGDIAGDPRVRARAPAPAQPGAAGRWLEVTVTNPSPDIALVAVGLGRQRIRWPETTAQRRTAGRRTRLSLRDRILGAVPAADSAEFHVWAEGDLRRLRLLVAVGTPGRLRLHRLPLPEPERLAAAGLGREPVDPREPAMP